MSAFEFIRSEKAKSDASVSTMCRVLGVSRSGFYAWSTRLLLALGETSRSNHKFEACISSQASATVVSKLHVLCVVLVKWLR